MCAPLEQAPPTLAAAVDRAHCWSEHALGEPGRTALASVWWLSTHLATVDRVVHPVASRTLPDGPQIVSEQRRRAADIIRALWTLEHALTGDGRVQLGQSRRAQGRAARARRQLSCMRHVPTASSSICAVGSRACRNGFWSVQSASFIGPRPSGSATISTPI